MDRNACVTYTFNYASDSAQGVGFLPFQFNTRQTTKLDSWTTIASIIIYQETSRRINTRVCAQPVPLRLVQAQTATSRLLFLVGNNSSTVLPGPSTRVTK